MLQLVVNPARWTCAVLAIGVFIAAGTPILSGVASGEPALAAATPRIVRVATADGLREAVTGLVPGTTVLLDAGTYRLSAPLVIAVPDVTLAGAGRSPGDAQLVAVSPAPEGGRAFSQAIVVRSPRVVLRNVTIRGFSDDAVRYRSGATSPRIEGVWFLDNGSAIHVEAAARPAVHGGVLEDSLVQVMSPRQTSPAGAVVIGGGDGWVLRRNLFRDVRGAGEWPVAVVVIGNGTGSATIDSNTFIDCEQEIVLGSAERGSPGHAAGRVQNNFIARAPWIRGGAAITVSYSPGALVLHNTALLGGSHRAVVELRSAGTRTGIVRNNLTDGPIALADGATATIEGNNTDATPSMFVDAYRGDLHLVESATTAIGQAVPDDSVQYDWDGERRSAGGAADIGADEFSAAAIGEEGTTTLSMSTAYAGPAVTSHASSATTTAMFTNVAVTAAAKRSTSPYEKLVFNASPDHSTLVSKYVFEVFTAGANPSTATPVRTQDLGKPSVVSGQITVDVASTIRSLASGSYFSTVRAAGSGGSTRSSPSNTFTR